MTEFRQYGYIEYADNISVLHSKLEERIKQWQVLEEVIQEVNEVLEEMMALQLEEESAKDSTDESNKDCTADVNENELGETDSQNSESDDDDDDDDNSVDDDIDVTSL